MRLETSASRTPESLDAASAPRGERKNSAKSITAPTRLAPLRRLSKKVRNSPSNGAIWSRARALVKLVVGLARGLTQPKMKGRSTDSLAGCSNGFARRFRSETMRSYSLERFHTRLAISVS